MLVGFVGLSGNQLNALLGAGIHVLDHLGVGRGQPIQFVDAVPDGSNLSLYVRLASKWMGEEIYYVGLVTVPEVPATCGLQRLSAGGAHTP
jgi:hypothetical protein